VYQLKYRERGAPRERPVGESRDAIHPQIQVLHPTERRIVENPGRDLRDSIQIQPQRPQTQRAAAKCTWGQPSDGVGVQEGGAKSIQPRHQAGRDDGDLIIVEVEHHQLAQPCQCGWRNVCDLAVLQIERVEPRQRSQHTSSVLVVLFFVYV
jgi:hypothetical protein